MMDQSRKQSTLIAGVIAVAVILISATLYVGLTSNSGTGTGHDGTSTSSQGTGGIINPPPPAYGLGQATAGAANATRGITVSGTGTVSFVPTEAEVSISVVTQGTTASAASASNAAETLAVIKALNAAGVGNASIETSSYAISPDYNYNSQSPPTITGYTVTNSIQVNVTSAGADQLGAKSGQVIDTAVRAGANQVSLQFTVPNADIQQLKYQALQLAVKDAAGKANAIAGALGVGITSVTSASEGYSYYPQPLYLTASAVTQGAASTPIMPGTLSVSASVQVTYAIS